MICINLLVKVVVWGSIVLFDMFLISMFGGLLLSFFWGYVGCKFILFKYKWGYLVLVIFMGFVCFLKGFIGIVFFVSIFCILFCFSNRC